MWFDCDVQSLTGLECGHKFCVQCWSQYLTTKIMDEGMGQVHTYHWYNLIVVVVMIMVVVVVVLVVVVVRCGSTKMSPFLFF